MTSPSRWFRPRCRSSNGVGEVQVFGAKKFAVRAEINPSAVVGLGIGIDQIDIAACRGELHCAGRAR